MPTFYLLKRSLMEMSVTGVEHICERCGVLGLYMSVDSRWNCHNFDFWLVAISWIVYLGLFAGAMQMPRSVIRNLAARMIECHCRVFRLCRRKAQKTSSCFSSYPLHYELTCCLKLRERMATANRTSVLGISSVGTCYLKVFLGSCWDMSGAVKLRLGDVILDVSGLTLTVRLSES